MADTAIEITAGSGTNVDTRTEGTNGNHRQVIVIGDPATNAGVAPVDATNGLAVHIIPALPAGTNAIGKLAANSGVDIGDVDVASCALPTGAATSAKQLADGHNVTCSGTVTANLSATDNAVLDAIAASVASATPAGTAIIGKVGIDQVTANANEVVVKTGSTTAVTSGTAANCKVEATIAAAQTVAVTNAGTFATQATLQTGSAAIGKLAANSGVDIGDVDVTSIAAGSNLIGNVDVAPRATGGWSVMNATSGDNHTALTGTAQVIKASAGKFGGYYIMNPNAAAIYVHVYNVAAASVTVGTTEALLNFCIPAGAAANIEFLAGIAFSTAMSWAATTTGGGNTNPTTALEAMCLFV